MKIVHLCLCGPVTDGWTYQENIISKYHCKLGYDVTLMTSHWVWDNDGKMVIDSRDRYVNQDGVTVIRLPIKQKKFSSKFKRYVGLYQMLEDEMPDVLFIHGCQFLDVSIVVKFLEKHPEIVTYVDNHADSSNSATNWISKNILHRIIWRKCAQRINPYV